jgi:hypothetical protein
MVLICLGKILSPQATRYSLIAVMIAYCQIAADLSATQKRCI